MEAERAALDQTQQVWLYFVGFRSFSAFFAAPCSLDAFSIRVQPYPKLTGTHDLQSQVRQYLDLEYLGML